MFYGSSIQDTRQLFFLSWKKYREKQALSPLEQQLVAVIIDHPEYHHVLEAPTSHQDHTWFPELGQSNPFLHMGLHLAIRDQIATDRPVGITTIYNKLMHKHGDILIVEHMLIELLAESLWKAQKNQCMVDEQAYLAACHQLVIA